MHRQKMSRSGNPFKMRKNPGKGVSQPNPRKQRRGDSSGKSAMKNKKY